jgi:hypothetical protein
MNLDWERAADRFRCVWLFDKFSSNCRGLAAGSLGACGQCARQEAAAGRAPEVGTGLRLPGQRRWAALLGAPAGAGAARI